eukprot:7514395-Pyramimonas_sp.AAC.1
MPPEPLKGKKDRGGEVNAVRPLSGVLLCRGEVTDRGVTVVVVYMPVGEPPWAGRSNPVDRLEEAGE